MYVAVAGDAPPAYPRYCPSRSVGRAHSPERRHDRFGWIERQENAIHGSIKSFRRGVNTLYGRAVSTIDWTTSTQ